MGDEPRAAREKDVVPVDTSHTDSGDADTFLAKRAARGDRAALSRLYDRHAQAAYSLAVRFVGTLAAEDVVHDAFVTLLGRPTAFDPTRGSFRSWLLTVVHHRCLNVLRGRAKLMDDEVLVHRPDATAEPADEVVQQLQDAAVRNALLELPEAQREVLVLAYYGGLSQSALAEQIGVPLGTVKARARRGLIALRRLLRGEALPADLEEAQ